MRASQCHGNPQTGKSYCYGEQVKWPWGEAGAKASSRMAQGTREGPGQPGERRVACRIVSHRFLLILHTGSVFFTLNLS